MRLPLGPWPVAADAEPGWLSSPESPPFSRKRVKSSKKRSSSSGSRTLKWVGINWLYSFGNPYLPPDRFSLLLCLSRWDWARARTGWDSTSRPKKQRPRKFWSWIFLIVKRETNCPGYKSPPSCPPFVKTPKIPGRVGKAPQGQNHRSDPPPSPFELLYPLEKLLLMEEG